MTDKIYRLANGRPKADINRYEIDTALNSSVPADFALLASAAAQFSNQLVTTTSTITVEAGNHAGPHTFNNISTTATAELVVSGDTNAQAGVPYVSGVSIPETSGVYGVGIVTITKSDTNQYTITRASGDPDFSGVAPGRQFRVRGDVSFALYILSTVTGANNNILTFTGAVQNVTFKGATLVLVPDVRLDNSVRINCQTGTIRLKKLFINAPIEMPSTTEKVQEGGRVVLENCVLASPSVINQGILATEKGNLIGTGIGVTMGAQIDFRHGTVLVGTLSTGNGDGSHGGGKILLREVVGVFEGNAVLIASQGNARIYNSKFWGYTTALVVREGGSLYVFTSEIHRDVAQPTGAVYKGISATIGAKAVANTCDFDYIGTPLSATTHSSIIASTCTFTNFIVKANPTENAGFGNNQSLITIV